MNPHGGELLPRHVPGDDAPWMPDIVEFALSFDAYVHFGGFRELADMANDARRDWDTDRVLPDNLVSLRSALFFEQRRWRHLDQPPSSFPAEGEWLDYVRALVGAIKRAAGDDIAGEATNPTSLPPQRGPQPA